MQPEISNLKNCTAVIAQTSLNIYPWLTVQCDAQYEASYVCQHIVPPTPSTKRLVIRTCDDDWFMINGSDKCFTASRPDTALSYYDAQHICSEHNASLLKVLDVPRNYPLFMSKRIKQAILEEMLLKREKSRVKKNFDLIRPDSLPNILFGERLSPDHPHSYLPHMIKELFKKLLMANFYVDINETCSVVQHSFVSLLMMRHDTSVKTRSWGVKCRSCSERLHITGIICEKESKPYIHDCSKNQFKCNDGTCILLVYHCDLEEDCFDGSDEKNCLKNISNMSRQTLKLVDLQIEKITEIQVHNICDGIYSNIALIQEEDSCFKYKLKKIYFSEDSKSTSEKHNIQSLTIVAGHFIKLYFEQKSLCLRYNNSHTRINRTIYTRKYESLMTLPRSENKCSQVNQLCRVGINTTRCDMVQYNDVCGNVICPGMFKCNKYFCIYMSYVCDGQYDCKEGDDETLCPLVSCPGMLKCRGENRCVSKEEMCDNTVNCLYSMDDEIDCYECPINCECNVYNVKCQLDNSLNDTSSIPINYTKGLTLTGIQYRLYVQNLYIYGLVYINASYCQIGKIIISQQTNAQSFIIIADFKYNDLMVIQFLKASIFRNVIYLDLSFNHLTTIKFMSFFLTKLFVLYIEGNPLKEIIINTYNSKPMLHLIDMRSISNYIQLYIHLSRDLYNKLNVIVSDSMMCCIFNKNIICTSHEKTQICMGLINNNSKKFSFYVLCIGTLLSSLVVIIKHAVLDTTFVQNVKHRSANNKKIYYFLILVNYSMGVMLNSLYFSSLCVADIIGVNVLFWSVSPLCLFLKLIHYNSIILVITFKTTLVIFLSLQIIYPFKHQCSFLKWTGPSCLVVWLIVSASSTLTIFEQSRQQDFLCSLGNCEKTNHLLLTIVCFVTYILILFCILPVSKTYLTLKRQKIILSGQHTTHKRSRNAVRVTVKIMTPLISELPFQFCLLGLLIMNLAHVEHKVICQSIFLLAFPVSVCFSSILTLRK